MNKSRSFSEAAKDLLTADQIKRLDNKKQIILSAEQRPILCNKIFYFKDKRFTERLSKETAEVPTLDVNKYLNYTDDDTFDLTEDELAVIEDDAGDDLVDGLNDLEFEGDLR